MLRVLLKEMPINFKGEETEYFVKYEHMQTVGGKCTTH